MKKKLVTVLLASSMVATMLAGCGSGSGDGTEKGSSAKGGDGSVYMLNFKPETDQAWQDLAEKYTDETGVQVTVVTAADGQYKTTLKSELAKKEAPTIFNIGSTSDCAEYDKYIYDLKDSEIYKHLTDKSLALEYNGKIASVANCYECYGIIYNKAILEKYCSNYSGAVIKSVDDIKDLDTLEKVATDINEHVDDINKACDLHLTEAFASAGLDSGSNWRFTGHLAGLALYYEFKDAGCDLTAGQKEVTGKYMDNFKRVWDMYTNTSAADKATLDSGSLNAESELGMEEAVFYQNGDWEYANFADDNENGYTVKQSDLSMIAEIGANLELSQTARLRHNGYLNSLKKHGITPDERYYERARFSYDSAYRAMKKLLEKDIEITAVYAISDVMAIGALRAILDKGLRVPEDISITGFDGSTLAEYYNPKIVSIRQPHKDMAARSVELLFNMIDLHKGSCHEIIPFELTEGESVARID